MPRKTQAKTDSSSSNSIQSESLPEGWLCREAAYAERNLGGYYGRPSEGSRKYSERIKAMHDHLGPHEGCLKDRTQPDGSISPE